MKNLRIIGCIACLSFFACQPPIQETVEPLALTESADDLEMRSRCPDGKVEWIFLQVNDVYEIAPLENGKKGGMARIATLKKRLLCENPNTYAFMAGDFVNPSVIGTLKYNGENIRGKQMIEVMNAAGIDYACFGNHEFDLNEADLQKRIDESQFEWIASNAYHLVGGQAKPFTQTRNGIVKNLPEYKILEIKEKGTKERAKVGLWSVLLPSNKPNYVTYTDFMTTSKTLIDHVLRPKSDAVVGLTHLFLEDDLKLAAQNPTLSLLMGGHDHENSTNQVGNVRVTKADANAATAFVHRFSYDLRTQKTTVKSERVAITDAMKEDAATAAVVKKWTDIANAAFVAAGFNPNEVVSTLAEPLDGRSQTIRVQQNNMGAAITNAMALNAKRPLDCAFMNSGAVRIDDWVRGTVTQLDIIRILPFGGKIYELDITGAELRRVLTAGLQNTGRGGYLQWYQIAHNTANNAFTINGALLDDTKSYHIMVNDFLISGLEGGLEFFNETNPNISNLLKPNPTDATDLSNDLRKALIAYLKR